VTTPLSKVGGKAVLPNPLKTGDYARAFSVTLRRFELASAVVILLTHTICPCVANSKMSSVLSIKDSQFKVDQRNQGLSVKPASDMTWDLRNEIPLASLVVGKNWKPVFFHELSERVLLLLRRNMAVHFTVGPGGRASVPLGMGLGHSKAQALDYTSSVFAVPLLFSAMQIEVLKLACVRAGFRDPTFVPEPLAAVEAAESFRLIEPHPLQGQMSLRTSSLLRPPSPTHTPKAKNRAYPFLFAQFQSSLISFLTLRGNPRLEMHGH
jgi:hypothetical protein